MLTKVQRSMQKGDTHPAYKALMQLSKPKCLPSRQLRHGTSGRQLHTASERITEWLRHVTHLFTATSPIAPEVLALITPTPPPPPTPPPLPSDPPTQKSRLAEVVTAIKRFRNNISPGVCNILPEMLKYGGDSVHSMLYRFMLGIWCIEQVPSVRTPGMISCYPYLRRCSSVQQLSHHCSAEHSWESLCQHVECMPFTVAGRHPS